MGNNSPKSGIILKQKLGLDAVKYVLLARCLATSAMRTYLIFFDSRNPNTPLSTGYILRTPMASMIYTEPFNNKPAIIAPMPIEEYNGDLNAVFFVIDIAGIFANTGIRTRVIESKLNESITISDKQEDDIKNFLDIQGQKGNYDQNDYILGMYNGMELVSSVVDKREPNYKENFVYVDSLKLLENRTCSAVYGYGFEYFKYPTQKEIRDNSDLEEALSLSDLKQNAVSDLNKKFFAQRKKYGNPGSKLQSVTWNESNDTIGLTFFVNPTYDKNVTNYSPEGAEYKDNKYICEIEFQNVSNYLGDKDTFNSFTPKEQGALVLSFLDSCSCKLYSSDPSFLYQSSWEYLDQVDASLFPYKGPKGKDIWAARHTGTEIEGLHITKHIEEVISIIKANYQEIAKQLRGENGYRINNSTIKEQFSTGTKSNDTYYEVYKNPTEYELKEIETYKTDKVVRAIIYENEVENIYISDGYCLHEDMDKVLKNKGYDYFAHLIIMFEEKHIDVQGDERKNFDFIYRNSWIKNNCKNFDVGGMLEKITEEFASYDDSYISHEKFYVYKNPTETEFRKYIPDKARGIIDYDGNVFMEGYEDKLDKNVTRIWHAEIARGVNLDNDKVLHIYRVGDTNRFYQNNDDRIIANKDAQEIYRKAKQKNPNLEFADLKESFVTGIKPSREYFQIFKNPSRKELKEIKLPDDNPLDGYKAIVCGNDIYVFNIWCLHENVYQEINSLIDDDFVTIAIELDGTVSMTSTALDHNSRAFDNGFEGAKKVVEKCQGLKDVLSLLNVRLRIIESTLSLEQEKDYRLMNISHGKVLMESFVNYAKPFPNSEGYMIFKNPDRTELNEILSYHDHKMLRGIINDNETYVSDYNLLHGFIIQEAKLRNGKENICFIVDERKGNIYIGDTSSEIGEGYCASIISNNPWIKEHFKNFDIYDNEAIENLMKVK
jgi:hypothetical protein